MPVQEMVTLALHRGMKPSAAASDSKYGPTKTLRFLEKNKLLWVLRSNRVVDYYEHLADREIPKTGLVLHLKAYGMINVFKTFS